jgi:hypothetical protein
MKSLLLFWGLVMPPGVLVLPLELLVLPPGFLPPDAQLSDSLEVRKDLRL